jgi:hypothetical protein
MNAPNYASAGRVLPAVWKLLLLRVRISWNSFRHAKTSIKILSIFGTLMLLAFGAGIFFVSWLLLGFLNSPELANVFPTLDPARILEAVPVVILAALFLSILLTSFGVLLQALYLSGDMDFLLAAPVPIRAVFVAKLLQAVLPNFAIISLFGLPVLYGLGLANHYNILYFPLVLIVMILLTLAAAGISALLVMLVVRVLPPRRAAEILGFLGGTLGLLCSQMGNFSNWAGDNVDVSNTQVSGMLGTLLRLNVAWMPLNWAGRGLVDLGEGRWLSALLFISLTLAFTALTFWFALATAERWYYSGWAGMQVVARKKKTVRAVRPSAAVAAAPSRPLTRLERLLPAPVRAILVKDALVLRRDLRNLSQLISPLILGVLYTFMLFRGGGVPAGQGQAPEAFMESINMLLTYGSVGMALFVGWMLLSRLAGMGFSSEGRNYWLLKASPLKAKHLLAAKFLVAYLPTLTLSLLFLVVISIMRQTPLDVALYSLLAITMSLAGMTGILLAFGVLGANFNWDDPRKMSAGGLGCLGQFLTMLYLPLGVGVYLGPLWLVTAFGLPVFVGQLIGLGVGTLVTGACAILPLLLVQKRVERLGE